MGDFVLVDPSTGKAVLHYSIDGQTISPTMGSSIGAPIKIEAGETPESALGRRLGIYDGVEVSRCSSIKNETPRGVCYFRMGRPVIDSAGRPSFPLSDLYANEIANLRDQLVNLMRMLQHITTVVHPCTETFPTYGHDIRNLLILAATEVETHLRSVLKANGLTKADERYTTNDYVRLLGPMKLDQYEVTLPYYPWLGPFEPFAGWTSSNPTGSLDWYNAYNLVKHDREKNFASAQLGHAFHAVIACAVLLVAQVGEMEAFRWRMEFGFFFHFTKTPVWASHQSYIPPEVGKSWVGENYSV